MRTTRLVGSVFPLRMVAQSRAQSGRMVVREERVNGGKRVGLGDLFESDEQEEVRSIGETRRRRGGSMGSQEWSSLDFMVTPALC